MTPPAAAGGAGRVPVAGLVDEVAQRHGAVVVVCPSDLVIAGERARLRQLLDELCAAALRAGAGALRIAAQGRPGAVALHVEADRCGDAGGDDTRAMAVAWARCGGTFRCLRLLRALRFTVELPAAWHGTTTA
ncbi:MAG: hypothetical protein WAT39_14905 [Planctomycetota bacterium]